MNPRATLDQLWGLLSFDVGLALPVRRGDARNPDAALFGSAGLYLYGLRDDVGDIDLAVTPFAYTRLLEAGWTVTFGENPDHPAFLAYTGLPLVVHAFKAWRDDQPEIDLPLVLRRAAVVESWPCAPLALIAHHKATALRRSRQLGVVAPEKHERDLAAIVARIADVDAIEIKTPADSARTPTHYVPPTGIPSVHDMASWIQHLRSLGVKAAHPDDGWVNRTENTIHLCYPDFDDKPQVGDLLALGDPCGWRTVHVTELIEPTGLQAPAVEPGRPWGYRFTT